MLEKYGGICHNEHTGRDVLLPMGRSFLYIKRPGEKGARRERQGNGMLNIVLVEPEIPQNTGNISRTCAVTGARLHLIEPLGFSIDEKHLRRAGLDYWDKLELSVYPDMEAFYQKNAGGNFYYFSTKAEKWYTEVNYVDGDYLVFGKETKGLPESLIRENMDRAVRIPMRRDLRCLNLSNSVAVAVYEAERQLGFFDFI